MNYCVSARQDSSTLREADEIMVESRDYKIIPELFHDYPDKTIILDFSDNIPIEQIVNFSKMGNLVCKIVDLREQRNILIDSNIQFYYAYPVDTFYDLNSLIRLNPYYITIAAPLTFCIKDLEQYNVRFRMNPTEIGGDYIPRENGIVGQYIRPEDISLYTPIYTMEFGKVSLNRERALFKVYKIEQKWSGNLRFLINGLNTNIDNRAIPEDFGKHRLNCKQKCQITGRCHYCNSVFDFCKTIEKLL